MRCDGFVSDHGVTLVLPGETTAIGTARNFVREQLAADPTDRADDIVLVVSELVTNAVEYGSGEIEVRFARERSAIEVVVSSESGDLPNPTELPAVDEFRGRGLHIVSSLSDNVAIGADHDVVTITCRFELPD